MQRKDDNVAVRQEEFEKEVLRFYGSLVGTDNITIEGVDINHLRQGKQMNMEQRQMVGKLIKTEEIEGALKSIGNLKAPGVDGFGAKF